MRRRIYKFLSGRFPSIACTLVIFILLSLPGKMLPDEEQLSISNLDKYVHILLFASFVFLWSFYYAANAGKNNPSRLPYLRILIIGCLYGIAMEYVQKYIIPNRDFDIYDIVADVTGALGGYLILRMMQRFSK